MNPGKFGGISSLAGPAEQVWKRRESARMLPGCAGNSAILCGWNKKEEDLAIYSRTMLLKSMISIERN